ASGPVGFSSPSVGEAPTAGPEAGTFGPPPVMPQSPAAGTPGVAALPGPRDARPPAPADPHPPTRPADHRPGKLSVSVAATSTPERGGRGRRVSCTVALAVAGALAAVTVGSVFVLDLLPGNPHDGTSGSDDGAQAPAPATAVPAAYLGTWEGQAASRDGISIPLGTFRVTVRQAGVGERVGTLRHTDIFGGVCDDVLTLKQVTDKQLVTTSVGAKSNRDVCSQARHTVRLTPVGDDLVYTSDSEASGRPEARLSKTG
ncbi:serine/threonine protein kinase, partial [Streptomyces sp. G35A]